MGSSNVREFAEVYTYRDDCTLMVRFEFGRSYPRYANAHDNVLTEWSSFNHRCAHRDVLERITNMIRESYEKYRYAIDGCKLVFENEQDLKKFAAYLNEYVYALMNPESVSFTHRIMISDKTN